MGILYESYMEYNGIVVWYLVYFRIGDALTGRCARLPSLRYRKYCYSSTLISNHIKSASRSNIWQKGRFWVVFSLKNVLLFKRVQVHFDYGSSIHNSTVNCFVVCSGVIVAPAAAVVHFPLEVDWMDAIFTNWMWYGLFFVSVCMSIVCPERVAVMVPAMLPSRSFTMADALWPSSSS